MKSLTAQLTNYATYHRDRRNIATHFLGIPMIFVAVTVLLARPQVLVGPVPVSPLLVVAIGAVVYYTLLDLRFGVAMATVLGLSAWFAHGVAAASTGVWLATGLGLFVGGWVIQFVGHYYEGKKPAFVDDLVGLLIGPLFIVAETAFALGLRKDVAAAVERAAGPTHIRALHPARQVPPA